MILNGVIRKYPKVSLNEFYGGVSYTASKLKNNPGRDPNPAGGDIRRAIAEYCILPMCKLVILLSSESASYFIRQFHKTISLLFLHIAI